MSINNINSVLQRKLSPGLAYSKLIEKSTCKVTSLGEGDTFHSIDKIKEYSLKYQHQTKAVADRLVKNSLKETVNSIYKFCYDHFQYKADGLEQNIKSPACAWHSRKDGMDCKSFSVLASTLCSNAGLKHYIRKIKQPFFHPSEFTHVYVIVPINQKTGSIENGYYVVDGTTHDNLEAIFTTKHDTYMDTMPHFGLNAPRPTKRVHPVGSRAAQAAINKCGRLKPGYTWNKGGRSITQHTGLNSPDGNNTVVDAAMGEITSKSEGWLKNIISKIGTWINCIGSSAKPKDVENFANNLMRPWTIATLISLNQLGKTAATADTLASFINIFYRRLETIKAHQLFHKAESRADCGRNANQAMADYVHEIIKVIDNIVNSLDQNYVLTSRRVDFLASGFTDIGFANHWKGKTVNATHREITLVLRPGGTPGFPASYNQVPVFNPGTGTTTTPTPGGGTNTTTPTPGGGTNTTTPTPGGGNTFTPGGLVTVGNNSKPSQAGMNWLVVALLVGGVVYGTKHFANQPNKK